MVDGIRMTLMIGQGTPSPASRKVIESLQTVEVIATSRGPSGFQMRFAVTTDSPLRSTFMLPGGAVAPMTRVIIAVTVNGSVEVLMDGVMTHHELVPAGKGQALSVTGEDLTRVMDYADTSGKAYPATSPEARARMILSRYANLGVTPQVVQSQMRDTPSADEHVPRHQGKDLGYLRMLADQVGHVFYLDPGPSIGQSVAYWGPEIRSGPPQPPLSVNFGVQTNVESLTFAFDSESASKAQGFVQDPDSKESAPVSGDDPGGSPRLGAAAPLRKRDQPRHEMAKFTPGRAAQAQKAATARSEHGVTGTGKLDVLRYGRVLKPRRLVGARGGGTGFDGIYHVRSVTHHIARGSYTQDFTLVRNGLVSTVDVLRR
jgi:hypothetical protein